MALERVTENANRLGIHKEVVAPFIGLVSVCTIAWVAVLIVLGQQRAA